MLILAASVAAMVVVETVKAFPDKQLSQLEETLPIRTTEAEVRELLNERGF